MLTAYFDESMENGDGFAVVAGFLGKKASWVKCVRTWRRTLKKYGRESIHMKEMRLRESHRPMLEALGKIPEACLLTLVFGSVNVGVYRPSISGTRLDITAPGYLHALHIALAAAIKKVPTGQRLEAIFESQEIYALRREHVCSVCTSMPEFQDERGRSKLAKWSSISKQTIIEPSDYAAYALLQTLRNPHSLKTSLCSPILRTKLRFGLNMSGDRSKEIIEQIQQEHPYSLGVLPTRLDRQRFIEEMSASF